MSTRKNKKREYVTAIPCIGPGIIRLCILCGQEIREGEHWRKVGNGQYAVGVHDACMTRGGEVRA